MLSIGPRIAALSLKRLSASVGGHTEQDKPECDPDPWFRSRSRSERRSQPSTAARRGSSARRPGGSRHQASGDDPPVIRPELEAEPFVIDPKIAVAAASDRIGSHRLHFLRDHTDVGLFAAIVCEAVVTKTVVEPTEQHDVVLEPDVRPAPTTASAATAKAATAPPPRKAAARRPPPANRAPPPRRAPAADRK